MSQADLPAVQAGDGPGADSFHSHPSYRNRARLVPVRQYLAAHAVPLCLLLILLSAAGFRLVGLDWDQGQHLHPDERFLTMVETALQWPKDNFLGTYFNEATSKLNPRNVGHTFFVYGDFPVILIKAISMALNRTGYDQVHLVGRAVDALVDVATVLVLFLLGRTLYKDNRVALLAAFLYAASALAIQQAHFFVVDNLSTFFVAAALLFMARVYERGRFWDYLLAGACVGLALASKVSIYSIAGVMALVGAYRIFAAPRERTQDPRSNFEQVAVRLVISGVVAAVAFRIFQPYAFQDVGVPGIGLSRRWLDNLNEAREWVTGIRDAPFAYQWTNRPPIVFPLTNMVLWGMGVPLGVAAWAGWLVAAWQLIRRQRWVHLIPVAWTAILFGLLGTQWVKSMRYFLPIYPTLALLAAWLLIWLWDRARSRATGPEWPLASILSWTRAKAGALLALVLVGTLLYALAFTSIYTRPHSRVAASRWILANVPAGTVVATETQWDDAIPLRIDNKDPYGGIYTGLNLDITAEESPDKLTHLLEVLDRAEYIFISSNRQYDSLTRLPMRFPLAVKYYQALFGGALGFERVAEFTSYPQLLGISLPDQSAEEAWTVYDHPRAQVFKKTPAYSHAVATQALSGVRWDAIIQIMPKPATEAPNALLLTPDEQRAYQAAGTWSDLFDPANLVNQFPVLVWALAIVLLGLVGLPFVWLVAAPLPDRGYALARPVGLLLVAWLVWWLGSLKLMTFSFASVVLSLAVLGALGASIVWRRRAAFQDWLRTSYRLLAIEETLFWGFFALVLFVRWQNPDLWHPVLGGEKPMDFAFLNAVVKSPYFPPFDPWFSGGYLNYYYFGFVLVATVIKLTGVVPAVAYNLAIPMLFAFLALAAFGTTLALVGGSGPRGKLSRRPLLVAFLGALFVGVIGNLGELTLILSGLQSLSTIQFQSHIPGLVPLVKTLNGLESGLLAGKPLPFRLEWWYWNATRVIQHPNTEAGPITEFPWFTFLYADLHAHLMALPYTVTALGLALAFVRELPAVRSRLVGAARLGLLALVIGALWPLNTWDFPTYALVALAAIILQAWRQYGRPSYEAFLAVAARWVLLLAVGYALFLPFHQHYGSAVSGIEPWKGSQTPLGDYLTIHGFFLFCIVAALLVDFTSASDLTGPARFLRLWLRWWHRPRRLARRYRALTKPTPVYQLGLSLAGLGALATLVLALTGKGAPGLMVVLLTLAGLLFFRRPRRRDAGSEPAALLWQMTLILFMVGLGLTLAVEFVVLKNIDISRMNTVFKFYLQTWVFWAIAAAIAVGRVFQRLPRLQPEWRTVYRTGFFALFAVTLLYPLFSTGAKIQDRFDTSVGATLDGSAFMSKAVFRDRNQDLTLAYDQEAMRWIEENVAGSPVMAEANTAPTLYGWGNRFAMFTGNPDVIGWEWHEKQQRAAVPNTMISQRLTDIQQVYGTKDPAQAYQVFQRYDVQYFIVGQLERAYFPEGQDKWEPQRGTLWDLVYENPGVKIYHVLAH